MGGEVMLEQQRAGETLFLSMFRGLHLSEDPSEADACTSTRLQEDQDSIRYNIHSNLDDDVAQHSTVRTRQVNRASKSDKLRSLLPSKLADRSEHLFSSSKLATTSHDRTAGSKHVNIKCQEIGRNRNPARGRL